MMLQSDNDSPLAFMTPLRKHCVHCFYSQFEINGTVDWFLKCQISALFF